MMKRTKTVNINLRLPNDLHKKLVEAGASNSPPNSLNSEILSRLYESFERPTVAALEKKVVGVEAYALARIQDVEAHALARMKEVDERADALTQLFESRLAELEKIKRRVDAKSK